MEPDFFVNEICEMVVVENQRGLHARAAAKLVRVVEGFKADVNVSRDDMRVSGRSIMGLMMLAAANGTCLKLCATGDDADAAVAAVVELVKRKFDED